MADNDTTTVVDNSQPEMVTITLNNREVEVPKEAADILKEQEHNLKSGYDAKLRDERASIQAEQEKHDALFAEDVEFYNTHPQEEWQFYKPKVDGGNGYTGKPVNIPSVVEPNTKTIPAFNNNPEIASLKQEIKKLHQDIGNISDGVIRGGAEQVKSLRDSLITKYPGAGLVIDTINNRLGEYYDTHNNTHAPPVEIERIVKAEHNKVEKYSASTMKGKTLIPPKGSTLPPAGGAAPSGTPKKTLSIAETDDFEEVVKRGEQFLKDGGLFQD